VGYQNLLGSHECSKSLVSLRFSAEFLLFSRIPISRLACSLVNADLRTGWYRLHRKMIAISQGFEGVSGEGSHV
jgi:phosphatidylserine/phosphatidylglycerophosphate/cardiolipin synthase-like enzyme